MANDNVLVEQRKVMSMGYMWNGLDKPTLRYREVYRKDGQPNKARSCYYVDGQRVTREELVAAGADLPTIRGTGG